MEASLDDTKSRDDLDQHNDELKVSYPLLDCLEQLRSKQQIVGRLFRERFEQIKSTCLAGYMSNQTGD